MPLLSAYDRNRFSHDEAHLQSVYKQSFEGTGLLTFALKQRETHEDCAHIVLSIYIYMYNHLKKSNCLTLVTQLI